MRLRHLQDRLRATSGPGSSAGNRPDGCPAPRFPAGPPFQFLGLTPRPQPGAMDRLLEALHIGVVDLVDAEVQRRARRSRWRHRFRAHGVSSAELLPASRTSQQSNFKEPSASADFPRNLKPDDADGAQRLGTFRADPAQTLARATCFLAPGSAAKCWLIVTTIRWSRIPGFSRTSTPCAARRLCHRLGFVSGRSPGVSAA